MKPLCGKQKVTRKVASNNTEEMLAFSKRPEQIKESIHLIKKRTLVLVFEGINYLKVFCSISFFLEKQTFEVTACLCYTAYMIFWDSFDHLLFIEKSPLAKLRQYGMTMLITQV